MRKLHPRTLEKIANLILGHEVDNYRSMAQIEAFLVNSGFRRNELEGRSRYYVAFNALEAANQLTSARHPDHANLLLNLLKGLIDVREYDGDEERLDNVIKKMNEALHNEGYVVDTLGENDPAMIFESATMQTVSEEVLQDDSSDHETEGSEVHQARDHDRVFIVHGHDRSVRDSVARFVEQLGLKAIVLDEQPNQSQTLIEKLEKYGQVDYAIILLTPDDIGGKIEEEARTRARQNVIFELGYFVGKIGRDRVCLIQKDVEEVPSDLNGITYIKFDEADGWMMRLAKELGAAGVEIDTGSLI